MEKLAVNGGYQLGFPEIQENDRLFDVADTEWLVIVVQHEHLAADPDRLTKGVSRPVSAVCVNRSAEVSNTSSAMGPRAPGLKAFLNDSLLLHEKYSISPGESQARGEKEGSGAG